MEVSIVSTLTLLLLIGVYMCPNSPKGIKGSVHLLKYPLHFNNNASKKEMGKLYKQYIFNSSQGCKMGEIIYREGQCGGNVAKLQWIFLQHGHLRVSLLYSCLEAKCGHHHLFGMSHRLIIVFKFLKGV